MIWNNEDRKKRDDMFKKIKKIQQQSSCSFPITISQVQNIKSLRNVYMDEELYKLYDQAEQKKIQSSQYLYFYMMVRFKRSTEFLTKEQETNITKYMEKILQNSK